MKESDGPRVFEKGAITQVLGTDGFNLYIGSLHIKYVESVDIHADRSGISLVKIKFQKNENLQKVEENIRLVKSISWIKIM